MKVYHFKQKQFIPADINAVWSFFSLHSNLAKITPSQMNFVISGITGSNQVYSGQIITYKVSPFPWLRVGWITEIKNLEYQKFFVDDQRQGPFAMWYHQHFFVEKDGGVEMTDEVSYAVPFGWLGRLANTLFIERQVKYIFAFRKEKIESLFPKQITAQ